MTKLERRLDKVESELLGFLGSWVAEYKGTLDIETLRMAFDCLFARYAVLRAQIRHDDSGPIIYTSNEYSPQLIVKNGDKDTFFKESAELIEKNDGKLVLPLLVFSEKSGYLSFGVDHALIDGASYFTYYAELWQIYTDILKGKKKFTPVKQFLPSAPSKFLKGNNSERSSIANKTCSNFAPFTEELSKNVESKFLKMSRSNCMFDVPHTAKIRKFCKKNAIGVGTFIASTAVTEIRDKNPDGEPLPMWIRVNIDHRENRRTHATKTTFATACYLFTIYVSYKQSPLAIAHQLKEKIYQARKEGHPGYPEGSMPATYIEKTEFKSDVKLPEVRLNGLGNYNFDQPEGLELKFYPFANWRGGNQEKGQWIRSASPFMAVAPASFNYSLTIDCVTFTDITDENAADSLKKKVIETIDFVS